MMHKKGLLFKKKLDPINTVLANAKTSEQSNYKSNDMFLSPSPDGDGKDGSFAFQWISNGYGQNEFSISPPSTCSSKDELSVSPLTPNGDSKDSFTLSLTLKK